MKEKVILIRRLFSGMLLGDIALPNVNYETEWQMQSKKNQQELEKMKQEVYNEGLQVEEEGLTEEIRKKTKHHVEDDSPKNVNKNLNEAIIVSVFLYNLFATNY